ncbi:MAG: ParB N-terminal domain-containing protein [Candidatus Bathyarchaeota archaeon]|nr:ParB N-terminal domain-containing protein [Candidatus Bathyarchaeota archaeon]
MASKKNNVPVKARICIVEISSLKPHERTDSSRVKALKDEIWLDGVLKKPIVVDEKTNVIIDGHHRAEALRLLGCTRIPVCYVDYMCDKIGLKSTAKDRVKITKDEVIESALRNSPFNPKSTWHYLHFKKCIKHISCIEKRVDMHLDSLK